MILTRGTSHLNIPFLVVKRVRRIRENHDPHNCTHRLSVKVQNSHRFVVGQRHSFPPSHLLCKESKAGMEGCPSGYRPQVGVCLINSDSQIFVASRLNVPGAWQMPQGGIEDDEEPKSAAIRGLQEETGIVSAEIVAEVPKWLTYDFSPAVKAKVNRLWGGEWHGQAQKWFLTRMTNDDSEINLANGGADTEFSEWKWASPEEVIEQAVDYKRPMYEEVVRTFQPYLN
ncbi:nudix hydrolase 25-like [Tripterygium wilfordii]|uniref:nudix hydrolase 25-like n=1 Tax=Tripterygium wilfordii TaxID=458696 RepID=UPI0018F8470B|nr:nudix hydrolase 25-like [Tripterygium wilfordii]